MLKILKNPFVLAFIIGIVSLHIVREFSYRRRYAPPALVQVGQWALTNQDAKSFGSKQIKGKVVIAKFFFTRCPTICPGLTKNMKEVYARFSESEHVHMHFLSFSVDPEHDKPKILKAYQEEYKLIGRKNWDMLTGDLGRVKEVIIGKMKLHVGDKNEVVGAGSDVDLYNIPHVAQLVLFDQNGDLRGKFDVTPTGLAGLVSAAKFLLEKGA